MNGSISVLVVEPCPEAAETKRLALESGKLPLEVEVRARIDDAVKFLEYMPLDVLLVEIAAESDEQEIVQLIQHLQSRHSHTAVVVIGDDDSELAVRICEEGAQDFVFKGHVNNGILARSVALAAGRHQKSKTDVLQRSGIDESLTSRANLDKLASMSRDMDEGEAGVQ